MVLGSSETALSAVKRLVPAAKLVGTVKSAILASGTPPDPPVADHNSALTLARLAAESCVAPDAVSPCCSTTSMPLNTYPAALLPVTKPWALTQPSLPLAKMPSPSLDWPRFDTRAANVVGAASTRYSTDGAVMAL